MQKILFTGALGFIGSNLVEFLCERYENIKIFVLDKICYSSNFFLIEKWKEKYGRKIEFIIYDILEMEVEKLRDIIKKNGVDTVIHFASETHVGESFERPLDFTKNNVVGTHILLESCRNQRIEKFIYMSTDEVYGESCFHQYADENAKLDPTSPYSSSKACAEILVRCYWKCYNIPIITVRSNNVFGKYQYPDKIIPRFIMLLLKGRECTIQGSGLNTRNYIYIDDFCEAFLTVMKKGKIGETYNIATEDEISNIVVARKIIEKMGFIPEERIVFCKDRLYNDPCYHICADKLRSIGWKQKISFDEGLRRTIEWYQENYKIYDNLDRV
jgi:dTDP-glucose 4,6-dehydratase